MYCAPCVKLIDVQHAEDHGQAEAQHGVEGAVDQAEQELAEQRLGGMPRSSNMAASHPQIGLQLADALLDVGSTPTVSITRPSSIT